MNRFRAALVPLCLLVFVGVASADDWDPAHTYVTLAMISEWQDKRIVKLPKTAAMEKRLEGALVKDGVPSDHVAVLRDKEVTKEALRAALVDQAKSTPKGSTLIFYYSGHGYRDGRGTVSLVPNEADQDHLTQTSLTLNEVEQIYEQYGAGKKILFLGDYCYSGALEKVVKKLGAHGIDAAALASSPALNESSENWTFTNAILDALNGDGSVAKDGVVTLGSLEHAARDAMLYAENQSMEFTTTKGFDQDFVIRKADPKRALRPIDGPYQLKDYVDAKARDGEYHRAQVVDEKSGRYQVRFVYADDTLVGKEQWLPVSRLRAPHVKDVAVGAKVRAHDADEGGWWSAIAKDVREGFALVTYDLLPRSFDEWLPTSDMKVKRGRSRSLDPNGRNDVKAAALETGEASASAGDPAAVAAPLGPRSPGMSGVLGAEIEGAADPDVKGER